MNFTERHHAFIPACFYKILKERDLVGWADAFKYAARRYAEQRGGRMAQRAIRDGKPLTIGTYCSYGEWNYTEEATAENFPQSIDDEFKGEDMVRVYNQCPWGQQFMDMGLKEGGILYCQDLDMSIARGFNPEVPYEVKHTMYEHGTCLHVMHGLEKDRPTAKKPENVRDFKFHCAHIYKVFSDIMVSIYKSEGVIIAAEVLKDFRDEYGEELADQLTEYRDMNFDYLDR